MRKQTAPHPYALSLYSGHTVSTARTHSTHSIHSIPVPCIRSSAHSPSYAEPSAHVNAPRPCFFPSAYCPTYVPLPVTGSGIAVCRHAHTHISMRVCVRRMCLCLHTRVRVSCINVCVCSTCMHACVHTTRTHMQCIYVHAYMYAHVCTYAYTRSVRHAAEKYEKHMRADTRKFPHRPSASKVE